VVNSETSGLNDCAAVKKAGWSRPVAATPVVSRAFAVLALGAVAVFSRPALAVVDDEFYRPLGWTADSAYFVYQHDDEYLETEDGNGLVLREAFVVSAREGSAVQYKGDALKTWLGQHPLAKNQATRSLSPDRVSLAIVEGKDRERDQGELKEGAPLRELEVFPGKTVRCLLHHGTESYESARFVVKRLTPEAPRVSNVSVSVSWSPDGRRIAWFFDVDQVEPSGGDFMTGHAGKAVIAPTTGPRIEVLGKGVQAATFARFADALEKTGFAPTGEGPAEEARATSVVYAAKGQEAQAKKIAGLIPGGATIGELNWKSPFDVVVALGASAEGH
jgi:hypothetical protein